MKLVGRATYVDRFESKKHPGVWYYQFIDGEQGGQLSLRVVDGEIAVKPGESVDLNSIQVKPQQFQTGMSLTYVSGSLKRSINGTEPK